MLTGLKVPVGISSGPADATPIPCSAPVSNLMNLLTTSSMLLHKTSPSTARVKTSCFWRTMKSSPTVAIATFVAPTSIPSAYLLIVKSYLLSLCPVGAWLPS